MGISVGSKIPLLSLAVSIEISDACRKYTVIEDSLDRKCVQLYEGYGEILDVESAIIFWKRVILIVDFLKSQFFDFFVENIKFGFDIFLWLIEPIDDSFDHNKFKDKQSAEKVGIEPKGNFSPSTA